MDKNILKFYFLQAFISLTFFTPVIVLFWQNAGLSFTQIMILQSLYSIFVVLMEVPTGYIADIFGRKSSIVFATIFYASSMFVYGLGNNFYHFLIAEIIWGLGVSLMSGADAAFIFDTLKDGGKADNFKKIWGNTIFIHMITLSLGSILGGFIGNFSLRFTLWFTAIAIVPAVIISLFLKEPERHKVVIERGYLNNLFTILGDAFKNRKLRWLMLYSGLIAGFNQASIWLYQPYFKLSGIDVIYFGIIFAIFNVVAGFASKYSHLFENKLGQKGSLFMLMFLVSVSYALMANFVFLFSFTFSFLHQIVRGFSKTVVTDYVNQLTDSSKRATILSAQSLINRLSYAIIIPFIGMLTDRSSIIVSFNVLALATFVCGLPLLLLFYKNYYR